MWDNFLTYKSEIPSGLGWDHYSAVHLFYLGLFVVATIVMVWVYKRGSDERRRKIRITYAVIVVLLEVIKDSICFFTGVLSPELLPFHLCGMTIILIVIHTARPNKTTGEILYSLSLPGAIAALLFSDWNMYPVFNFFCQQSFFIHFFEFSYPILLIASGELRPRFSNLWRVVVFLLIVVPPIYFFNHAYDTNFFFLNEAAADSPLSFLQALMGNPGYIIGFIGLLFLVWVFLYLPWNIKTWREKRALVIRLEERRV
jgi:hypothetical integral membrane protein (TIGR02206 family)